MAWPGLVNKYSVLWNFCTLNIWQQAAAVRLVGRRDGKERALEWRDVKKELTFHWRSSNFDWRCQFVFVCSLLCFQFDVFLKKTWWKASLSLSLSRSLFNFLCPPSVYLLYMHLHHLFVSAFEYECLTMYVCVCVCVFIASVRLLVTMRRRISLAVILLNLSIFINKEFLIFVHFLNEGNDF